MLDVCINNYFSCTSENVKNFHFKCQIRSENIRHIFKKNKMKMVCNFNKIQTLKNKIVGKENQNVFRIILGEILKQKFY